MRECYNKHKVAFILIGVQKDTLNSQGMIENRKIEQRNNL